MGAGSWELATGFTCAVALYTDISDVILSATQSSQIQDHRDEGKKN
jgi:hypothetical protein